MIHDLVSSFRQLSQQLLALKQQLQQQAPQHWLPLSEQEQQLSYQPLSFASDIITDLWYRDGQDGRETRSRHGIIMADDSLITQIQHINQLKDQFRACVQAEKARCDSNEQWQQSLHELQAHGENLRASLTLAGLSRLHLKQTVRHIPLLDHSAKKVGFSWYQHGRSIKQLTHQQAQQKLLELGEEKSHIQLQLSTLSKLSANTKLAQVQTLAPIMRANIVFDDSKEKPAVARKAMNVSLPLFIPGDQLPAIKSPELTPSGERSRQHRGDNQLLDEPLLPSIRVFGYRQ